MGSYHGIAAKSRREKDDAMTCPVCKTSFLSPKKEKGELLKHVIKCSALPNSSSGTDEKNVSSQLVGSTEAHTQSCSEIGAGIHSETLDHSGGERTTFTSVAQYSGVRPTRRQKSREVTSDQIGRHELRRRRSAESAPFKCPECHKQFPAAKYTDVDNLEKAIVAHMMKCSASNGAGAKKFAEREAIEVTEFPSIANSTAPDRKRHATAVPSKKAKKRPLARGSSGVAVQDEAVRCGEHSLPVAKFPVNSTTSAADSSALLPEEGGYAASVAKPVHVVESGHLLTQTWWKKDPPKETTDTSRRLRTSSKALAKFNLESCIMKEAKGSLVTERKKEVVEGSTVRKSTRIRERQSEAELKLCCPICQRVFSLSWMDMSEQAMSIHISRCRALHLGNLSEGEKNAAIPHGRTSESTLSRQGVAGKAKRVSVAGPCRRNGQVGSRRKRGASAAASAARTRSMQFLGERKHQRTAYDILLGGS